MTPGEAASLAKDFRDDLIAAIGQAHDEVVAEPGAGVARIRVAVTGVALSRASDDPGGLMIGGADMEAEIVDSVTAKRLGAMVDSSRADVIDATVASPDPYHDARVSFRHWSSRLVRWLGQQRVSSNGGLDRALRG